jgi:hypothetical protein
MNRKLLAALCVAFLGLGLLSAGEVMAQSATNITDGCASDDVAFVQTKTTGGTGAGQPGGSPGAGGSLPGGSDGSLDNLLRSLRPLYWTVAVVDILLGFLPEEVRLVIEWAARQQM